jgi:hypothetical protein
MKIRTSFVSNSSSSSFVIGYHPGAVCPTCKRPLDVDFVARVKELGPGMESEVLHESAEAILQSAQRRIEEYDFRLHELDGHADDEKLHPNSCWTVGKERSLFQEVLGNAQERVREIREALDQGMVLAEVELSNHYEELVELMYQLQSQKKLVIVAEEDHT